jgi:hypothetical protein
MGVSHLKQYGGDRHSPGKSGIHIKASHRGLLHKKLGVPQGEPIPTSKIKAAENSGSESLRKEAQFADNAKKWNK